MLVKKIFTQFRQNPHLIEIAISTPRRPAGDSFDYSGEKYRYQGKRSKHNEHSPGAQQQQNHPAYRRFNMNVLKRAMSSNLPSFFINFSLPSSSEKTLSSIQVAILLKKARIYVDIYDWISN
jgi:hypothetical protein